LLEIAMTLTDAAQAMVNELRDLAAWEAELARDLAVTRGRGAELTRSLASLLDVLPREDRRALKIALARIEMPRVRRLKAPSIRTGIVEAVHDYLAAADDTVTALDLQAHLAQRFGARAGRASIILSRKVAQGMVERLSRGRYRVNPRHPEIAARRAGMG
jgi:hypothetical protein